MALKREKVEISKSLDPFNRVLANRLITKILEPKVKTRVSFDPKEVTLAQPEKGDIGPRGPQGIQGPQGPQGEAGRDGADGRNGVDGNSHLNNVEVILFDEKSGQIEIRIKGYEEPFRLSPNR